MYLIEMEARQVNWNKKVANARGPGWRKKLLAGRLEINMNPTILRVRRIKKNFTQEDMALNVKLSISTYAAIESGQRPAKKKNAERISEVLEISLEKVFEKSEIGSDRFTAKKREK